METYIKTIINGLKSWVTSCLSRLEISVSGSLADLTNKLTSLSNNVMKNTKDISQAQSTADKAQSTADKAQSTADKAQSTAVNARSVANQTVFWGDPITETLTLEIPEIASGFDILGYNLIAGEQYTANGRDFKVWNGERMDLAYGAGQINVMYSCGIYTITLPDVVVKGQITGKLVKTRSSGGNFASPAPYLVHTGILIASPYGSKTYRITVSNDGTLTTTEVTA